jgi:plasmid maintenance system antidote protein VapI
MDEVCRGRAYWVDVQIGQRLEAALQDAGKLKADLAKHLNVAEERIIAFCEGLERMSPDILVKSSEFLGQSVLWFFSFTAEYVELPRPSTVYH